MENRKREEKDLKINNVSSESLEDIKKDTHENVLNILEEKERLEKEYNEKQKELSERFTAFDPTDKKAEEELEKMMILRTELSELTIVMAEIMKLFVIMNSVLDDFVGDEDEEDLEDEEKEVDENNEDEEENSWYNCDCERCKKMRESLIPELGDSSVFYPVLLLDILEYSPYEEIKNLKSAKITVKLTEKNNIICNHMQLTFEKEGLSEESLEEVQEILNTANFPQFLEIEVMDDKNEISKRTLRNEAASDLTDIKDIYYGGYCEIYFSSDMEASVSEDEGIDLDAEEKFLLIFDEAVKNEESITNFKHLLKKLEEFYPDAGVEVRDKE